MNLENLKLLSTAEMTEADRRAVAGGIPQKTLMENAGRVAAEIILERFPPCPTVILCGPGNNGGDGFVVARHLAEAGWPVTVATEKGEGKNYEGAIVPFGPSVFESKGLAVDALFGIGLTRTIEGIFGQALHALIASKLPVVALDIPSGISGDTGQVLGIAAPAQLTITFARRKLGHALIPGRAFCGEIIVADIGIPTGIITDVAGECFENHPALWSETIPWPRIEQHKYDRGHALVMGGPISCAGAAKLAAHAALRLTGLATIACSADALPFYAPALAAVMTHPLDDAKKIPSFMKERKVSAVLIGPGHGVGEATRNAALTLLQQNRPLVLDADALTSFEKNAAGLFAAIKACKAAVILTPHLGEFRRLFGASFPEKKEGTEGKVQAVRKAAKQSGAIVALKGSDTVIADPKGCVYINTNAPATLATAGSGDVLSGIVLGLLAAGMPGLQAAGAAVWIHGECANRFGLGLTADDFDHVLPEVLHHLAYATKTPPQG